MEFEKGFFKLDDNNYLSLKHAISFKNGQWSVLNINMSSEIYHVQGYFDSLDKAMEFTIELECKYVYSN